MTRTTGRTAPPTGVRRRRSVLLGTALVAVVVAAVAMVWFQPWKLWVDDTVDEAAPAGAVPVTVRPAAEAPATTPTSPAAPLTTPPVAATSTPAAPASTATPPTTVTPTTAPAPTPVGGPFSGIDHGTTGTAVVLQDAAGALTLRLENLDTSNGPDLYVYLSTNAPDGPEGQFDDDIVDLGRLQGNVGSSNYVIPAGTDLTRYASVVIWCDRFNSAFGAAPLL